MSFLADTNIVATASFSVTVSGVSFGALDATPSSRIGASSCQTTAWVSGTSVACLLSLGVGTGLAAQATVSAVAGTQTTVFTYDGAATPTHLPRRSCSGIQRLAVLVDAAPVVSFSVEANAAVTAGYSVTVSGLNFGVDATTPTSTIGLSSCATASWASTSSVICMLSMGEGVSHELRVTVSGVVGSRTSGFSYDGLHPSPAALCSWRFVHLTQACFRLEAPVVSFESELNGASTAGWSVTVSGLSFGGLDATPTSTIGLSHCLTAAWASSTSVVCHHASGDGVAKIGMATVSAIVGTRTATFSYDGWSADWSRA